MASKLWLHTVKKIIKHFNLSCTQREIHSLESFYYKTRENKTERSAARSCKKKKKIKTLKSIKNELIKLKTEVNDLGNKRTRD